MFKTPIPLPDFPELAIGKLKCEAGAQLATANVVSTISAASEVAALKLFVIGRRVFEALADLVLACTTGREQF